MRLILIIVLLGAVAVGLVQIRRAETVTRYRTQQIRSTRMRLQRVLWDQQIDLANLTAPAEIRHRAEEMALNLTDKSQRPTKLARVDWQRR